MGLCLAVIGAGGPAVRDRWANFWVVLAAIGGILMLGKFTFLYDYAHRIPVLGSSREPVRFHLWVSLAVAALAAVGVERLGRPGEVRLRSAAILALFLVAASIPILLYVYAPVWTHPRRWTQPYHIARYQWLGREFVGAAIRDAILLVLGFGLAWKAARTCVSLAKASPRLVASSDCSGGPGGGALPGMCPRSLPTTGCRRRRRRLALKADPGFIRVFGMGDKSAGRAGLCVRADRFPGRTGRAGLEPAARPGACLRPRARHR